MKFGELIQITSAILTSMNIPFIFSGALAANAYRSAPRATMDLDVAIPFEETNLTRIKERFKEFEVQDWDLIVARLEIKKNNPDVIVPEFLRLKHEVGYEIDFFPLNPKYLARKFKAKVQNIQIELIGPEDLIVIKSIFARHKDLDDILNILENPRIPLDLPYLIQELRAFDNFEMIKIIKQKRGIEY
ncbi:MAG: hypothetical protein EU536_00080 [Promethearchaeota archaeon]|nr:MAG: hypothetical protein EU536_00080 [Candidatus Lokiarchaeota archaeon]